MRGLLDQELEADEIFQEEEDDVEFEANDEKDIVDSDFDDTSSEDEAEDEGEQQLQAAEKATRKRATVAAAKKPLLRTRTKVAVVERAKDGPPPAKKVKVAAPTVPSFLRPDSSGMRKSSRSHTVSVNKNVQKKLKEYQRRRSEYQAKAKPREETRPLTQKELLEEAIITEEENVASLNQWKSMEAERRKASRVLLRKALTGPVISYRSFKEGYDKEDGKEYVLKRKNNLITIREYRPRVKPLIEEVADAKDPSLLNDTIRNDTKDEEQTNAPIEVIDATEDGAAWDVTSEGPIVTDGVVDKADVSASEEDKDKTTEREPRENSAQLDSPASVKETSVAPASKGDETEDEEPATAVRADSSSDDEETPPEFVQDPRQSRNVVILTDFDQVPTRYSIVDVHYEAIFGPGTRLQRATTVREKIARNRRPEKPICPISGVLARYRDPATNVPYANKECFGIIRKVLQNEYVWSTVLNAYVHRQDQIGASGVPEGFQKALVPPDADDVDESMDLDIDPEEEPEQVEVEMVAEPSVKEEVLESPRSSRSGRRSSRGGRRRHV